MNKLAIIAAAALSATTFGLAAIAQDNTEDAFDKADANKDSLVSYEEAMGVYPTLTQVIFDQADANKDGNLDEGEFTQLQGLTAGTDTSDESSVSSSESSESSDSSSSTSSSSAS